MCTKKTCVNPKFDFSWMEKEIKQWRNEFRKKDVIERSISIIPENILFYADLDNYICQTCEGEPIYDMDDYRKQKDEFVNQMILKYGW